MSTKIAIGVLIFTVALSWAGLSARQSQREPGQGSGVATVTGTVTIGNTVPVTVGNTVQVNQAGEWKVAVANTPTVIPAIPGFLNRGGKYTITWGSGEREIVTIRPSGAGVWVQADSPNQPQRWINTALVRSMEEIR